MNNFCTMRLFVALMILSAIGPLRAGHSGSKLVGEEDEFYSLLETISADIEIDKDDERSFEILLIRLSKLDRVAFDNLIDAYNFVRRQGKDFGAIEPWVTSALFSVKTLAWLIANGFIDDYGYLSQEVFTVLDSICRVTVVCVGAIQRETGEELIKVQKIKNVRDFVKLTHNLIIPVLSYLFIDSAINSGFEEDTVLRSVLGSDPKLGCGIFPLQVLRGLRAVGGDICHFIVGADHELVTLTKLVRNIFML